MRYIFETQCADDLFKQLKDDDIVEISGKDLMGLMNGRGSGNRGRKAIQVEASLFNEMVTRWQNGEITARQAMQNLNLKPNTFYRRIKELKEKSSADMADIRKEIDDIKARVHEDAVEIQNAATDAAKKHYSTLRG